MCQWRVSYCVCRQHSFSGEPVPWGSKAGASCWIPLLPRVQRDVSQQVGSETLDWAVNILKEKGSRFKQIPVVLKIKPTEHRTQFMFGQLTSLCSLSSLYRTGCSGLASVSGPGLRQFSHLQPWWGGANRHACSTNVTLRAKGHSQHPTIPAVLQSRCRCRWHPGTPSATGFPPGKLFHRRSTLSHLCFTQETLSFICRFEKKMRGKKMRPYVVHTWTLLCHFPNKCNSSSDHFLLGGPIFLRSCSWFRRRGTILTWSLKKKKKCGRVCKWCSKRKSHMLTGWIASEVAAAQTQALAPQLETCLRHPLPFTSNLVVGCSKRIVTQILSGKHFRWDWNAAYKNVDYFVVPH